MGLEAPATDQVEVNLFGPGFGECVLVHLGARKWFIIDSCVDPANGTPAALDYLRQIGADPAIDVELILVSHWHDDHVRGLGALVDACASARVCVGAALNTKEFFETAALFNTRNGIQAGSGTSEIMKTFKIVAEREKGTLRQIERAQALTQMLFRRESVSGKQVISEVIALSPSSNQFNLFLSEIARQVPKLLDPKRRVGLQGKNHLSVATWIETGDVRLLLGSDLEERGISGLGWAAVLGLSRTFADASVFKVPHHGSATGFNPGVSARMLLQPPLLILTPWVLGGSSLPAPTDAARILASTPYAFITADPSQKAAQTHRPYAVESEIRAIAGRSLKTLPQMGHLRLRTKLIGGGALWGVETFGSARHLAKLN